MLKQQIVVGKAYVNEDACMIREVIEEVDEHRVRFNSFELVSGRLAPTRHQVCEKQQLARWAHREASEPERALVHPYAPAAFVEDSFARDRGRVQVERARAAIDGAPGHTFPPGK